MRKINLQSFVNFENLKKLIAFKPEDLKELTICQQMKQHLISLKICTAMHWPKVDLNIRSYFSNRKIELFTVTNNTKYRKRKIIWFNPP